jgi:hypothetical protein
MPIPKLLSRKFNIDCVNVAGLLTRVRLPTFPPYREKRDAGSGFEEVTGIPQKQGDKAYSCGNSSGFTPDSLLILPFTGTGRNRNSQAR